MISMKKWSELIIELEKSGWSLVRIGKSVGLSPQAISDLKQGYSKEPRGMAAVRLYKLHKKESAPGKSYPSAA